MGAEAAAVLDSALKADLAFGTAKTLKVFNTGHALQVQCSRALPAFVMQLRASYNLTDIIMSVMPTTPCAQTTFCS